VELFSASGEDILVAVIVEVLEVVWVARLAGKWAALSSQQECPISETASSALFVHRLEAGLGDVIF